MSETSGFAPETATQNSAGAPSAGSSTTGMSGNSGNNGGDSAFGYSGSWGDAVKPLSNSLMSGSDPADNPGAASSTDAGERQGRQEALAGGDTTTEDELPDWLESFLNGPQDESDSPTDDTDEDVPVGADGKPGSVPYERFRERNERAKLADQLEAEKAQWEARMAQIEAEREQERELLRQFGVSSVTEIPAALDAYNRQREAQEQYQQIQQERANVVEDILLSDEHKNLILKNLDAMEQRLREGAQISQVQAKVQQQQAFIEETLRTQALNTVTTQMPFLKGNERATALLSGYDPADIPEVAGIIGEIVQAETKRAEREAAVRLLREFKKRQGTLPPEGRGEGVTRAAGTPGNSNQMSWYEAALSGQPRRGTA
jgi:hypothetical protein